MAFPVIQTTAETAVSTAGTSHQITLPTGIAVGDGIVIILDKGSTSATFNSLAGWNELIDVNAANGMTVWYRQADGTEGSTVTFTSSASTRSASIAFRISGQRDFNVQAPEISTVASGTSTGPDATTCTPTGGAKDYLWISFAGMAGEEADDDTWGNSQPTNYTPNPPLQKACGTVGTNLGGLILAASRQLNAASEDAGAFNVDVSAAWNAYTIAIHPQLADTPSTSASYGQAGIVPLSSLRPSVRNLALNQQSYCFVPFVPSGAVIVDEPSPQPMALPPVIVAIPPSVFPYANNWIPPIAVQESQRAPSVTKRALLRSEDTFFPYSNNFQAPMGSQQPTAMPRQAPRLVPRVENQVFFAPAAAAAVFPAALESPIPPPRPAPRLVLRNDIIGTAGVAFEMPTPDFGWTDAMRPPILPKQNLGTRRSADYLPFANNIPPFTAWVVPPIPKFTPRTLTLPLSSDPIVITPAAPPIFNDGWVSLPRFSNLPKTNLGSRITSEFLPFVNNTHGFSFSDGLLYRPVPLRRAQIVPSPDLVVPPTPVVGSWSESVGRWFPVPKRKNLGALLGAIDVPYPIASSQYEPTAPGIEFTVINGRLHYAVSSGRVHFTVINGRLHYTVTDEDH